MTDHLTVFDWAIAEGEVRQSLKKHQDRHGCFQASQRSADAEVDTVAERDVVFGIALYVQSVGILELRRVSIRRSDDQRYGLAFPDLPCVADVL